MGLEWPKAAFLDVSFRNSKQSAVSAGSAALAGEEEKESQQIRLRASHKPL